MQKASAKLSECHATGAEELQQAKQHIKQNSGNRGMTLSLSQGDESLLCTSPAYSPAIQSGEGTNWMSEALGSILALLCHLGQSCNFLVLYVFPSVKHG